MFLKIILPKVSLSLILIVVQENKTININIYNSNTINTDINVFIRNYVKPQKDDSVEVEDDFSGIMLDLDLIKYYKQLVDNNTIQWFKIESQDRLNLPYQIVLFAILDRYNSQQSISFRELQSGYNSPGIIFALNAEGLYRIIQEISINYKLVVYSETAGNQLIQFKSSLNKYKILNEYYNTEK